MLRLSDFNYNLPHEQIAQAPAVPRDASRLLVLNRSTGSISHDLFKNLGVHLDPNDLLVLNNSRVFPARVFGKKVSGGKVELLLLSEKEKNLWECLVRPGRRIPPATKIALNGKGIQAEVVSRAQNGMRLVRFHGVDNIKDHLKALGEIPFPPYIRDTPRMGCVPNPPQVDPEQYQTVYAKSEGSVAAPTAGLHFTPELIDALRSKGISFVELTHHVGWGTFRPVRSEEITGHVMEKEWYSVSPEAAEAFNQAQKTGRRIVAVGTTSCRVLEGFPLEGFVPKSDWTNLFIYPGFVFKHAGGLLTNFHLPRSTLLMLVCAFAGQEPVFKAYEEAIKLGYRFYSFGDAMLIL